MNKTFVVSKLHEITDYYLLGLGTWPLNSESLPAFFKTIRTLGLNEDVPESRERCGQPRSAQSSSSICCWRLWEHGKSTGAGSRSGEVKPRGEGVFGDRR